MTTMIEGSCVTCPVVYFGTHAIDFSELGPESYRFVGRDDILTTLGPVKPSDELAVTLAAVTFPANTPIPVSWCEDGREPGKRMIASVDEWGGIAPLLFTVKDSE